MALTKVIETLTTKARELEATRFNAAEPAAKELAYLGASSLYGLVITFSEDNAARLAVQTDLARLQLSQGECGLAVDSFKEASENPAFKPTAGFCYDFGRAYLGIHEGSQSLDDLLKARMMLQEATRLDPKQVRAQELLRELDQKYGIAPSRVA